jgi:putative sensor protein
MDLDTPGWRRRLGRDSVYTLTALPYAVVAICLVAVLVSLGAGLLVIGIGLPILALGLVVARGFAFLERRRLGRLTGTPAAQPEYRRADEDATVLRRLAAPVRDPQSWLDVVWAVVGILTGTLAWSVAVVWWSCAIGGTTYGIWEQAVPRGTDPVTLASLLGFGDGERADILVISAIGVLALLTLPFALRTAALLHSTMAGDLLCGRAELPGSGQRCPTGAGWTHADPHDRRPVRSDR